MSASCSAVGSTFTAQSPWTSTRSARHMKDTLETRPPGSRSSSRPERTVCAVVCVAPDTMPSAMPRATIRVPQ